MQAPAGKSCVMAAISGRQIDLSAFCEEDVCLLDVSHALSLQCRAGGHFERSYSVAQHCLNCEAEAWERGLSPTVRLACLLHDAGEAYLSDLIRPVKALLPDYAELERRIDAVVFSAFGLEGLTPAEWVLVRRIDDAMLYYEFLALRHDVKIFDTAPEVCRLPDTGEQPPEAVRRRFDGLCRHLLWQADVSPHKIHRVTRGGPRGNTPPEALGEGPGPAGREQERAAESLCGPRM